MKEYLKLIRVKHWLKNLLVFLPIFFSATITHLPFVGICIIAFFVFSFTSSIVYIINDMEDVEKDRLHPIKKERPLAKGTITKKQALITLFVIAIFDILLVSILYTWNRRVGILLIPLAYLFINILYSKKLKNIPIIDVFVIVAGFILRVMLGGLVIDVEVSKFLYLMIMFGSLYLGFGKRRNEIMKNGDKSRKVLEMYNKEFLDKNMYVFLTLAIISYTLWCLDPSTITRVGNDYMFWTIPLLILILQLYSLNIEGNSHGDPIEVLLGDKKLLIAVIVYIIVMGGILYLC